MKEIIITNNKMVYESYNKDFECIYSDDYTYRDILESVRSNIHRGSKLLTHPLSGSLKPNETPFKTIMISREADSFDFEGLKIIEESIIVFEKFYKDKETIDWAERILDDFRVIDYSLIENVIKKII